MPSENDDILTGTSPEDAKNASEFMDKEPMADNPQPEDAGEGNSTRVNAAKAFFRAMYAGDEVDAQQYGMNVGTVKSTNAKGEGACSNCDSLSTQVEQLEARANEMEGLYKRMAADFENYRKRIEREKEELASMGIQKTVEAILPALDDLDRAHKSFNQSSELGNVIESIKLIADKFTRCLEQIGVKQLNTVGKLFDPRLHEPVQQVKNSELKDGSIADDLRRGYALGEKVIRPALVNVVGNDIDTTENLIVEKKSGQNNSEEDT